MRRLVELGFVKDVRDNVARYIAFTETLYYGDLSTCVRLNGAHIALFLGALIVRFSFVHCLAGRGLVCFVLLCICMCM